MAHKTDVVTGAFGYIGRYITERLLHDNRRVLCIPIAPTATIALSKLIGLFLHDVI